MAKVHLKRKVRLDQFLQELVIAALSNYHEFFQAGKESQARERMKRELRIRFREILRIDMEIAEECGLSIYCQEASFLEPWSREAERALRESDEAPS